MDPTADTVSFQDLPLSDQDRQVLVFMDQGWRIMPTPSITDNGIFYNTTIRIDEQENAAIERMVTTKGFVTSGHRWYLKYTHPLLIKEDIQKKMVSISPFATLVDYEIKNADDFNASPVIVYSFKADKFLNPARNLRIVPKVSDGLVDLEAIGKEKRNFPIDFDSNLVGQSVVTIYLPDNLTVKYMPIDRKLENSWFSFKSSYGFDNKKIAITTEFEIKERFVQQDEYKEFKKQLEQVLFCLRERVILEKIKDISKPPMTSN